MKYLLQAGNDKDRRCLIHQAIRKSFPGFESNTIELDNTKLIKVHKAGSLRGKNKSRIWCDKSTFMIGMKIKKTHYMYLKLC